jgi:hypothetical protein
MSVGLSTYAKAAAGLPFNRPGHFDPASGRLCVTVKRASERVDVDTPLYAYSTTAQHYDAWTFIEGIDPHTDGVWFDLHYGRTGVRSVPASQPVYLGKRESAELLATAGTATWQVWSRDIGAALGALADTGAEADMRSHLASLLASKVDAWLVDPLGFRHPNPQALILTKDEAQAAVSAMRALNAIGARLDAQVPYMGPRRVTQRGNVIEIEQTQPPGPMESYSSIDQFAAAYQIEE